MMFKTDVRGTGGRPTDQFLSIDPLVDQTGQPYVFTNDNPLNSTDPLGLAGTAVFLIEQQCKKTGCKGGDLISAVIHLVGKAAKALGDAGKHLVIGGSGCFVACATISMQNGVLSLSVGGAGLLGVGPFVGLSSKLPGQRSGHQEFVSGGLDVVGSVSIGLNRSGKPNFHDVEVDVGPGFGAGAGQTKTIFQIKF
jgi:hypothetical protein